MQFLLSFCLCLVRCYPWLQFQENVWSLPSELGVAISSEKCPYNKETIRFTSHRKVQEHCQMANRGKMWFTEIMNIYKLECLTIWDSKHCNILFKVIHADSRVVKRHLSTYGRSGKFCLIVTCWRGSGLNPSPVGRRARPVVVFFLL